MRSSHAPLAPLGSSCLIALAVVTSCSGDVDWPSPPAARLESAPSEPWQPKGRRHPAGHDQLSPALRAAYVQAVQETAPAEYHVAVGGEDLRATNPAMGFSVRFEREGVVVARDGGIEGALGLTFAGVVCGAERIPSLGSSHPVADGPRVVYRRIVAGIVVEAWYLNGPLGLEQGFSVEHPPCHTSELVLEVEIGGAFEVVLVDERALEFRVNGILAYHYTDLVAVDAAGRELPARLDVRRARVRMIIDTRGATYPVMVDPLLWGEQPKLTSSDGAGNDYFGARVAVSGDTAVVTAPGDDHSGLTSAGSAYVFDRTGGVWSEQQKLIASDTDTGDNFGGSVAISGDTVIVGAANENNAGGSDAGSAYVYVRTAGVWSEQQKLIASDGTSSDFFGNAVSLWGDTAVVGAYLSNPGGAPGAGSAYVFERTAGVWSEVQKLTASDATFSDYFGYSVSLWADTVVVGAHQDDHAGGTNAGSAYVFVRTAGVWSEVQKLIASDAAPGDLFGAGVSLSVDTLLAGAYNDDHAGGVNAGSAYAFVRTAGVWSEQQKLIASDAAGGDRLGSRVAVMGDTAVVAAYLDDHGGLGDAGSAYVFVRSGSAWSEQQKLTASDAAAGDYFGGAVGVSDDTVMVGSPYGDNSGGANAGSAYVFAFGKANGDPCVLSSECASGACVDDFCCDTPCGGSDSTDCQACSIAAGGPSNGACALLVAVECRSSAGACDVAESCDGVSAICPDDDVLNTGTECRAAAGGCDFAETCDGLSVACPTDALAAPGSQCRGPAGGCDITESCDGTSAACPVDVVMSAGTECRATAGDCDLAETCDGASSSCPADGVIPAGTECRPAAGSCDVADACDGASRDCPDRVVASGTECRGPAGACDAAETCNGVSGACPADRVARRGTECRAVTGKCDIADTCDGASTRCPADVVVAEGTECGARAGDCDAADRCDGVSGACLDRLAAPGTECRAAVGVCDAVEFCTGFYPTCPGDQAARDGTACEDGACVAGVCVEDVAVDPGCGCGATSTSGPESFAPWAFVAATLLAGWRQRRLSAARKV